MNSALVRYVEAVLPRGYLLGVVVLVLGFGVWRVVWKTSTLPLSSTTPSSPRPKPSPYSAAAYTSIEPSPTNPLTTQPLAARPFKPKYHLTMALESCAPSALLEMDSTYLSRVVLRTHLITTQRAEVLACEPIAEPAVHELYAWVMGTYLPARFPGVFESRGDTLWNHAMGEGIPLVAASAEAALEGLGRVVDGEFLVLMPESSSTSLGDEKEKDKEKETKYHLRAFITCFPAGFRTRDKLGLKLADIHGPVPGYKAKLELAMDRFFAGLEVGRVVKRWNWTVGFGGDEGLFCLGGLHGAGGDGEGMEKSGTGGEAETEVDLKTAHLRCERQTLHRLPVSGAIVFAFKTYTYPLSEIRDEGSGEAMAEAIDGLSQGSVPRMAVYKKQVVWGEKVKAYLRGDIEA